MMKFLAALIFLSGNLYVYWYLGSAEVIPPRESFAEFPDSLSGWECGQRELLEDDVIDTLMVTDYLSCVYQNAQSRDIAHVYVGYHQRQTRDRDSGKDTAIHPPEHCLPGSGWDIIDSQVVPIAVGGGGEAKRFVIAKGNSRSLVYFWYHSRGRVLARSHEKILFLFLDRATRGRSDGSLVRFTVPILNGDVEAAEQVFEELAGEVTPRLALYVPD